MRVLVQRVSRAKVTVDGDVIGEISRGLLLLVGITQSDSEAELVWMASKCANLRVFADDAGQMNRSLTDIGGDALVVSQFTLYGDVRKGNRPSFIEAARPEVAEPLYARFCALLSDQLKKKVKTGRFAAMMDVELVNDGPVTLLIERERPD
jgi:D-tyrosyl-tRNA(Tyr) deacylase